MKSATGGEMDISKVDVHVVSDAFLLRLSDSG